MGGSITDLENDLAEKPMVNTEVQVVMADALIGSVKETVVHARSEHKLHLWTIAAVSGLVSVPLTYLLTFDHVKTTNAVSLRLALLSPFIFLIVTLVVFGPFWLMRKWFSLWFVMLVAGIIFFSAGLAIILI